YTSFELYLQFAPMNSDVVALVNTAKGQIVDHGNCQEVRIKLTAQEWPYIRQLAKAIGAVEGTGDSKRQRAWTSMCRRTTRTLNQFANHLRLFERQVNKEMRAERRAKKLLANSTGAHN